MTIREEMHRGEKHGLYTNDDWIFIRVENKEQCPDTAGKYLEVILFF